MNAEEYPGVKEVRDAYDRYEIAKTFRERFPKEFETVKAFIEGHLTALSLDWGIKVPKWYFRAGTTPGGRLIDLEFSAWFIPAWRIDRHNAGLVLKHAIAHEFRHWLTFAAHIKNPIPRRFKIMRRGWAELQARTFARKYSGITHEMAYFLWDRILSKIEEQLGIPIPK